MIRFIFYFVAAEAISFVIGTVVFVWLKSSSESKIEVVYITASGHDYHKLGCRYLRRTARAVTKTEAIRRGLNPCGRCEP